MRIITFLILSSMFASLVSPIFAQDATESTTLIQNESSVTFEQLRSDYLFQLEKYREAQDVFNLDKAEFYKLGTLVSREQAVASMKPYLVLRAKVLATYLAALEFLVQDMQGIDVNDRRQTLERSLFVRNWLREYILSVEEVDDRTKANESAALFENNVWRVFEVQHRLLSLVALGPVQVVYDQLELATEEFDLNYVETIPEEGKQSVIRRGMNDVIRENEKSDQKITAARDTFYPFITDEQYLEAKERSRPDYQYMYNSIVSNLQDSFSSMKQSVRFLQELERQL